MIATLNLKTKEYFALLIYRATLKNMFVSRTRPSISLMGHSVSPSCFYFYRTFGLVIEKTLPDQTNFYQTEKNSDTYKMLIILCSRYLIS
jgi:hypothetical protein